MPYILEGPRGMANVFGFWRSNMLQVGRWAIVEDGEFSNGGHGPISVNGRAYHSRDAAEADLRKMKESSGMITDTSCTRAARDTDQARSQAR